MKLAFLEVSGPELSPQASALVRNFPTNLETARKVFALEPDTTRYACCPKCFAIYPPKSRTGKADDPPYERQTSLHSSHLFTELPFFRESDIAPSLHSAEYPLLCTFQEIKDGKGCGHRLLQPRHRDTAGFSGREDEGEQVRVLMPIKIYCHQSMKSWLARLLLRPEMEKSMDSAWIRLKPHIDDKNLSDIWDAPEIYDFEGVEENTLFRHFSGEEGRYLFGLSIDWFNPHGNKQAGKSVSSGVIFMTCLNLPLELRYKRENVYLVGVIPGPKSPSLDQVHRFLGVLVDELLEFWSPGVRFSSTCCFPRGRLIRCAVIPLIADIGAIKKTAGQGAHNATFFCSFCDLKHSEINNIARETWTCRNCETRRRLAFQWRDASSVQERKRLFKQHGVRWTELLRLPYWKHRYVVLDVMHNLFLGLFQRHCRNVFGIDLKDVTEDTEEDATLIEEEASKGQRLLDNGCTPDFLARKLKKRVLQAMLKNNNIAPGKLTKGKIAELLVSKVCPFFTISALV